MKNDENKFDELDTSAPEMTDTEVTPIEQDENTSANDADDGVFDESANETIDEENESDIIDGQGELFSLPLDEIENNNENIASNDEEESETKGTNEDIDEGVIVSEDSDADAKSDDGDQAEDEEVAENKESEEENAEKPRRIDSIFDFVELFVFVLAAVFILTSFFFRYSIVDGGSMMETLEDDEMLILRSFLYTPECGDIVVVQDKTTALDTPIVKRVIAVGGQTVRFTKDAVFVDGIRLSEPYVYTEDYKHGVYRYDVDPSSALLPILTDMEEGIFYEITVPEGEIFVMGDHRNNSTDSRIIGTLHEDAVIGKVVLRFFPFEKFGKID